MPALDRGDGVCRHLDDIGLCSIYNDRPDLCDYEKVYEKYYKGTTTREEFFAYNKNICVQMRRKTWLLG